MRHTAEKVQTDGILLAMRIESLCNINGMSQQSLAQKAEISRTLFSNLKNGKTNWPHPETLKKIADVFEMSCGELCDFSSVHPAEEPWNAPSEESRLTDRKTNPIIAEVVRDFPELFQGWRQEDWDEIYSCFGVGGALSEEGVKQVAMQIDKKRELLRRVSILFETGHHDKLVNFIDDLYQSVQPPSQF